MTLLARVLRTAPLLLLAGSAVVAACGDSPTTQESLGPMPARMDIVSGNSQQAVAGTELPEPVVVRVLDAEGRPIEQQIVNFLVTAGGGSVYAGTSLTNADGLAQERWTLGATAGAAQALEARAVDASSGDKLVFATFAATALSPAPVVASVSLTPATSNLVVGGTRQLSAAARDAEGDTIPGTAFTWTSSNTTVATVSGSGLVTAKAAGEATISASAGDQSATATVNVTAAEVVDSIPPGNPATPNITTSPVSADSFAVAASWTAVTDAVRYQWTAGSNSGGFAREGETTTRSVTFRAPVLDDANGYWFCVSAVDSAGNSSETSGCAAYETPEGPAPTIASVVVAPATVSVAVAATAQLSAVAEDADGDTIPTTTFTWSSGDTDVATVNASGRVTGVAAGTATITAAAGGESGTSTVTVTAAAPTVASVSVSPATASLAVGATRQLTASALDAEGDAIAGKTFTWASGNTSVATVNSAGLVTAVAAGNALVTATVDGKSDTASITVTAPAPTVATVAVSPASASLDVGDTRQLSATARDAGGATIPGKTFTWSSSDSDVATVSTSGLVTARAAGSATITASVDGKSGTSTITVADPGPGPGGGLANECASAQSAWIWCDDFDQDRLNSYFEYDDANGDFVRANGVGMEGSVGMRASFAAGQVGAGSLKLAFGRTPTDYFAPVDAGTTDYREIYFRFYFRNDDNWRGGGGDKLARAISFARSDWSEAMIAHLWSGATGSDVNYLLIEPASGTDAQGNLQTNGYNDFENLRWIGSKSSTTPVFDSAHVGEWHCVESRVRLNDAGQSNGVFELWINGQSEAQSTGLNWVGAYDAYGINSIFVENFWNNGSPQAQERYFDNLVVSTQRIGCGG